MIDMSKYVEGLERDISRSRDSLKILESGEMTMGRREGNGPWVDTTQEWIHRHRENIGELEEIVRAIKTGKDL